MLALRLVDTAPIPGESAELGLYERGQDYFITIVGGQDLMNTRAHASEDALGSVACRKLMTTAAPRVLIGGLGMGFTLAAALKALPPDAEVVVAEIVPGIVEWNRGALGPFAGHPLDDARRKGLPTRDLAREAGPGTHPMNEGIHPAPPPADPPTRPSRPGTRRCPCTAGTS